jgi:hypothetical protein
MRTRSLAFAVLVGVGCSGNSTSQRPAPIPDAGAATLRGPEAFAAIQDPEARARALFAEASKVLLHPRCVNCHPPDDTPRQGDQHGIHDPPVFRGPDDHGLPALECQSCHQDRNAELARIPGAPGWHLAPIEMAWLGKSAAQICAQIKDPARNGGKPLAAIHEHMAHDPLVAWGWDPGDGRTPAPGTQERLGALIGAWIEAGAACPAEEAAR